jgi:hypothetical protein
MCGSSGIIYVLLELSLDYIWQLIICLIRVNCKQIQVKSLLSVNGTLVFAI